MKNKNAQAWGIDLIIAGFIFTIGITSFYLYTINYTADSEEVIETLRYEGNIIADIILSEGYPKNWTLINVVSPGILSENKINETKLQNFYTLTISDYPKTKTLFNTRYDYLLLFNENLTIGANEINKIGKPGVSPGTISSENLIKITRFTIYKNTPITVNLYIWEK